MSVDIPDAATRPNVRWERRQEASGDGVLTFRISSWLAYFDFLDAEVFSPSGSRKHSYIWRGQRRDDWSLSTSLDRLFEKAGFLTASPLELERMSDQHLESFKYAARGRRGPNPVKLLPNEWWAVGQHYGLATPLLDWSYSPFAAAYFAFEEMASDPTAYRVVFGLDRQAVELKSSEFSEGPSLEWGRAPVIDFFDPLIDESPRLVSQGGLFSRAPIGTPVERWVTSAFEGSNSPVLMRVEIPDSDRTICLQTLNRMNINHLSLFPDLAGASRFANLKLELSI